MREDDAKAQAEFKKSTRDLVADELANQNQAQAVPNAYAAEADSRVTGYYFEGGPEALVTEAPEAEEEAEAQPEDDIAIRIANAKDLTELTKLMGEAGLTV